MLFELQITSQSNKQRITKTNKYKYRTETILLHLPFTLITFCQLPLNHTEQSM